MTQLKPIKDLFAIEVPEVASKFEVRAHDLRPQLRYEYFHKIRYVPLPVGSYKIPFTTLNCTEDQAAGVLGKPPYCNYVPQNLLDPNRDDIWLNVLDSLNSLLRVNGLDPKINYLLIKKN